MGSNRTTKLGYRELAFCPAWIRKHGDFSHLLFFLFFYSILANIPFWTASDAFGLVHHGLFCLEYAAVGLLALFVPRILAAGLLLLLMATDLVCGACRT